MIARACRLSGLALIAMACMISACSRQSPPPADGARSTSAAEAQRDVITLPPPANRPTSPRRDDKTPRLLRAEDLTPQEQRYGISPTLNDEVVYQPDVIIVENGSEAIRGLSDNGLVWRVDARLVPEQKIQVGKIVFLTSRAVGRVLHVGKHGNELELTLGPADLTEIIRDCDISVEEPVDFSTAIVYTLPSMPGNNVDAQAHAFNWPDGGASVQPVSLRHVDSRPIELRTKPLVGLGTLGVEAGDRLDGLTYSARTVLHILQPRLRFELKIGGGQTLRGKVELIGAAGLEMSLNVAAEENRKGNTSRRVQVPGDIVIPIGGALPLTITVRQQFIVVTFLDAKGWLSAKANYSYNGGIGIEYTNGGFRVTSPSDFSGRESLLNSVQGASLKATGLSLSHQIKVIGGIGAWGFAVGPYVFTAANINVSRHSELDTLARCVFTGFSMDVGSGVGYVIPQPVTSAINAILGALNLKQIEGEGGIDGPRETVFSARDFAPKSDVCQKWQPK